MYLAALSTRCRKKSEERQARDTTVGTIMLDREFNASYSVVRGVLVKNYIRKPVEINRKHFAPECTERIQVIQTIKEKWSLSIVLRCIESRVDKLLIVSIALPR